MHSRFALLSHILPPSPSGQAVMLYRILSDIKDDAYYLIQTRTGLKPEKNTILDRFRLQSRCYVLPTEPTFNHLYFFGLSWLRNLINIFVQMYSRTKNILAVLHNEPDTGALLACTGDFVDIPAAFLASRIRRIPFYAYIFDDYVFQWTGSYRLIAKCIAPFIFKRSAGIIGPNEFICQEYERRYGVASILIRNPCGKDELSYEPLSQWPTEAHKIQIVYTGALYHANLDCFRNLIQAMETLAENELELHVFTAQTQAQLEASGIKKSRKIFIHSHIPYDGIVEEQRKADILFLPLAFDSPIPEVLRTSAPGKMGEYLASGRPVLAHVPADSFVAHYMNRNQCGAVADKNDPSDLAGHILKLAHDDNYRRTITGNARRQAKLDFDPRMSSARLKDFLASSRTTGNPDE